jgi:hypothetical protein
VAEGNHPPAGSGIEREGELTEIRPAGLLHARRSRNQQAKLVVETGKHCLRKWL